MKETSYQKVFSVEGMTCASCVRIVERQLSKVEGVSYVSVNLATEKALIISEQPIESELIEETIKKSGYTYLDQVPSEDQIQSRFLKVRRQLIQALIVTIPMMILMIIHMSGVMIPGFHLLELITGLFVLIVPGRGVLKGAFIAVTHGHTNMDTLVSMGAILSWLTVPLLLFGLPILSFGALSSMLIAFHITGRYIESRLKYRASTDIRSLLTAQSPTANLITSSENQAMSYEEVTTETVKKGARLFVRTGERIPLDGTILDGSGYIDTSMVTGEPTPVAIETGTQVIGGTILTSGSLIIVIDHTGEDTFLSRMIKLVEEAQSSHVPIQALADRITKVFIPIIFSIAILSSLLWFFFYPQWLPFLERASQLAPWIDLSGGALSTSLSVFIAVLVIACPCALGLATPMALVTGSGTAAKRGIIIKDGEAIQAARDISILLLDKTGTITEGRPKVIHSTIDTRYYPLITTLERHSTHPLALAILESLESKEENQPEVQDIKEISGLGVVGIFEGELYTIGRPVTITDEMRTFMKEGATVIACRKGDEELGYFAITDQIKPDSKEAIERIIASGITPVMVTGDQQTSADSTAAAVGITKVHAALHPDDKLEIVRSYQKRGYTVAMVGDGINDAASLKAADVGIALGTGTDLSIESAGVIIVSGELCKISDTIELSKRIFTTIRENLLWASLYNLIAIPIATAALLHPGIAEIAMTISSINVIVNSMRIRSFFT